jgi:predicted nucleic acid-binding protein
MKVESTRRLALDASLALAWFVTEETTAYTEGVLDLLLNGAQALAPAIWPFEVANALLVGERRRRFTVAQVTAVLERLAALPITVEPVQSDRAFGAVLSVARQEQLTEYDAAYLELALREALPLATLDRELRRAAENSGIALVTI